MKKFFKAASILAAVSMMFAFASCQQDPETPATSGTAPVFKAETKTVDLSSLGVTSITEPKVADEKIATVKADGAKVTVTSVAKGTTAATITVEGKKDGKDATGTVTFSITVAETGKITTTNPSGELTAKEDPVVPPATKYKCDGCGTEYATEEEKNNCAKQEGCPKYVAAPAGVALPYSLDFKTVFASNVVEGNQEKPSASGSYAAGKCFIVTDGTFDNDLIVIESDLSNPTDDSKKSSKIRVRTASEVIEASGLNYNGGTAAAFASTTVGETLSDTLDRSVGVDTSKLDATGSVTVTFKGKAVGSGSANASLGQIVLIDADSKILASKTDLGLTKDTAGEYEISATVSVGTKVILGFSRGGAGAGGLDVTEISVATAAE